MCILSGKSCFGLRIVKASSSLEAFPCSFMAEEISR